METLVAEDVKVWFGGIKAVDGISVEFRESRMYGVVGPNGSGKTTFINALSGIGPLTSGRIYLDGARIDHQKAFRRARMGLSRTFQGIRLLPTLTVRENVMLAADRLGAARRSRHEGPSESLSARTERALTRVAVQDVADRHPQTLPYGTQRRVEIARALVGDPRILLLDEPVAGMNDEERAEIAATLKSLADEGLTQVVIEHDLKLLQSLCDELVVMNFGKRIAMGPPAETAALPAVREAYLGLER